MSKAEELVKKLKKLDRRRLDWLYESIYGEEQEPWMKKKDVIDYLVAMWDDKAEKMLNN